MKSSGYLVLALTVLVLFAAGCSRIPSTTYDNVHADTTIDTEILHRGGVVIGGFVLGPGVALYPSPDLPEQDATFDHREQSYIWSPLLAARIPEFATDARFKTFAWFADTVDDSSLTVFLDHHADRVTPSPELWQALAASGLDARYILIARIESDDVQSDTHSQPHAQPLEGGLGRTSDIGRDRDLKSVPLAPAVRRTVEVTLDLLDIQAGCSVWQSRARHGVKEKTDQWPAAATEDLRVTEADQDDVILSSDDRLLDCPPLARVLDECLDVLVRNLLEPSDARPEAEDD